MAAPSSHTLALILAAGKGTRMRSAQPKVMLDLGGVPMLAHVLAAAGAVAAAEAVAAATRPTATASISNARR